MRLISALLFASSAVLALSASAQTRIYCCDAADGRKVCGDYLPTECQNRAHEERDNRGFVSKLVEAPLTPEQEARRDAEMAKKEEMAKKVAEERRRTLALLSTYSSEKDINTARDRALAELNTHKEQAQQRLDEANKKKAKLEGDKEFYKGKPLPNSVTADIRDNEKEIKAQQATVAAKLQEMEEVRARFADEKKRYLELTGKGPAGAAPVAAQ
ncbi:MAG: hypothetical protein K9K30_14725 [Burkholderiaceae bacterium]|nr:hypothetical protein [Sulfuritalea sp.]MCF8176489.1 hypothetical protein [Burkholderiaceae bacterium]MCF8184337.1 hypothetical protein [Polynucleobacter sp.]